MFDVKTKEQHYRQHIEPLVEKLFAACDSVGIPCLAVCNLELHHTERGTEDVVLAGSHNMDTLQAPAVMRLAAHFMELPNSKMSREQLTALVGKYDH
jgi:hypothetical protein